MKKAGSKSSSDYDDLLLFLCNTLYAQHQNEIQNMNPASVERSFFSSSRRRSSFLHLLVYGLVETASILVEEMRGGVRAQHRQHRVDFGFRRSSSITLLHIIVSKKKGANQPGARKSRHSSPKQKQKNEWRRQPQPLG